MTLPPDLFYPVGVTTAGVFIRKGVPHPKNQPVLWVRGVTDGLQISKGKRLPSDRAGNDLERIRGALRGFIHDPALSVSNIEQLQKAAPIDFTDRQLELVPEAYLDQKSPTDAEIQAGIDGAMRDSFAYLVKINRAVLSPDLLAPTSPGGPAPTVQRWQSFKITDLFDLERGDFHAIEDLDPGAFPTISRIASDNGFVGFYDKPEDARVWPPKTITVSTVTGDAFVQPIPFIVTDNVVLCIPKGSASYWPLPTLYFIQFMLNAGKWRYSYGRQCYKKKFEATRLPLPVTATGELDHETMAGFVNSAAYWPLVKAVYHEP